MKKEIRGLKVGEFLSPCDSVSLRIKLSDDGAILELVDFDADTYYAFTLDRDKVIKFEVDQITLDK